MSLAGISRLWEVTELLRQGFSSKRKSAKKGVKPFKKTHLQIDPLEERHLLSLSVGSVGDVLVNTEWQDIRGDVAVDVNASNDVVATWTAADQITDPVSGEVIGEDLNIYARYLTDEVQVVTIPIETAKIGQSASFELLYGSAAVQRLSIYSTTPISSEYNNVDTKEDVIGEITLSLNGAEFTFTYDATLTPKVNAQKIQKAIRSLGADYSEIEVTAYNETNFDITYYGDAFTGTVPELKIASQTYSSGFNPSVLIETTSEPTKITAYSLLTGKETGITITADPVSMAAQIKKAFVGQASSGSYAPVMRAWYYDSELHTYQIAQGNGKAYQADTDYGYYMTRVIPQVEVEVTPLETFVQGDYTYYRFQIVFTGNSGYVNQQELKVSSLSVGGVQMMENNVYVNANDPESGSSLVETIKESSEVFRVNAPEPAVYATDADGNVIRDINGDATLISDGKTDQYNPDVAFSDAGDFVIVWQSDVEDTLNPYNYSDIFARRFTIQGHSDDESKWNFYADGGTDGVPLANSDPYQTDVDEVAYVQCVRPLADQFCVNTETNGTQELPAVACDSDGNFVVTWTTDSQWNSYFAGIVAAWFDNTGLGKTGDIIVKTNDDSPNVGETGTPLFGESFAAMGPDGVTVIVWNYANDLYKSVYAPGATEPFVNTELVAEYAYSPSVDFDNNGRYVLAWTQIQDGTNASYITGEAYCSSFAALYSVSSTEDGQYSEVTVVAAKEVSTTDEYSEDLEKLYVLNVGNIAVGVDADGDAFFVYQGYGYDTQAITQLDTANTNAENNPISLTWDDVYEILVKTGNEDLAPYFEAWFGQGALDDYNYAYTNYPNYYVDPDSYISAALSSIQRQIEEALYEQSYADYYANELETITKLYEKWSARYDELKQEIVDEMLAEFYPTVRDMTFEDFTKDTDTVKDPSSIYYGWTYKAIAEELAKETGDVYKGVFTEILRDKLTEKYKAEHEQELWDLWYETLSHQYDEPELSEKVAEKVDEAVKNAVDGYIKAFTDYLTANPGTKPIDALKTLVADGTLPALTDAEMEAIASQAQAQTQEWVRLYLIELKVNDYLYANQDQIHIKVLKKIDEKVKEELTSTYKTSYDAIVADKLAQLRKEIAETTTYAEFAASADVVDYPGSEYAGMTYADVTAQIRTEEEAYKVTDEEWNEKYNEYLQELKDKYYSELYLYYWNKLRPEYTHQGVVDRIGLAKAAKKAAEDELSDKAKLLTDNWALREFLLRKNRKNVSEGEKEALLKKYSALSDSELRALYRELIKPSYTDEDGYVNEKALNDAVNKASKQVIINKLTANDIENIAKAASEEELKEAIKQSLRDEIQASGKTRAEELYDEYFPIVEKAATAEATAYFEKLSETELNALYRELITPDYTDEDGNVYEEGLEADIKSTSTADKIAALIPGCDIVKNRTKEKVEAEIDRLYDEWLKAHTEDGKLDLDHLTLTSAECKELIEIVLQYRVRNRVIDEAAVEDALYNEYYDSELKEALQNYYEAKIKEYYNEIDPLTGNVRRDDLFNEMLISLTASEKSKLTTTYKTQFTSLLENMAAYPEEYCSMYSAMKDAELDELYSKLIIANFTDAYGNIDQEALEKQISETSRFEKIWALVYDDMRGNVTESIETALSDAYAYELESDDVYVKNLEAKKNAIIDSYQLIRTGYYYKDYEELKALYKQAIVTQYATEAELEAAMAEFATESPENRGKMSEYLAKQDITEEYRNLLTKRYQEEANAGTEANQEAIETYGAAYSAFFEKYVAEDYATLKSDYVDYLVAQMGYTKETAQGVVEEFYGSDTVSNRYEIAGILAAFDAKGTGGLSDAMAETYNSAYKKYRSENESILRSNYASYLVNQKGYTSAEAANTAKSATAAEMANALAVNDVQATYSETTTVSVNLLALAWDVEKATFDEMVETLAQAQIDLYTKDQISVKVETTLANIIYNAIYAYTGNEFEMKDFSNFDGKSTNVTVMVNIPETFTNIFGDLVKWEWTNLYANEIRLSSEVSYFNEMRPAVEEAHYEEYRDQLISQYTDEEGNVDEWSLEQAVQAKIDQQTQIEVDARIIDEAEALVSASLVKADVDARMASKLDFFGTEITLNYSEINYTVNQLTNVMVSETLKVDAEAAVKEELARQVTVSVNADWSVWTSGLTEAEKQAFLNARFTPGEQAEIADKASKDVKNFLTGYADDATHKEVQASIIYDDVYSKLYENNFASLYSEYGKKLSYLDLLADTESVFKADEFSAYYGMTYSEICDYLTKELTATDATSFQVALKNALEKFWFDKFYNGPEYNKIYQEIYDANFAAIYAKYQKEYSESAEGKALYEEAQEKAADCVKSLYDMVESLDAKYTGYFGQVAETLADHAAVLRAENPSWTDAELAAALESEFGNLVDQAMTDYFTEKFDAASETTITESYRNYLISTGLYYNPDGSLNEAKLTEAIGSKTADEKREILVGVALTENAAAINFMKTTSVAHTMVTVETTGRTNVNASYREALTAYYTEYYTACPELMLAGQTFEDAVESRVEEAMAAEADKIDALVNLKMAEQIDALVNEQIDKELNASENSAMAAQLKTFLENAIYEDYLPVSVKYPEIFGIDGTETEKELRAKIVAFGTTRFIEWYNAENPESAVASLDEITKALANSFANELIYGRSDEAAKLKTELRTYYLSEEGRHVFYDSYYVANEEAIRTELYNAYYTVYQNSEMAQNAVDTRADLIASLAKQKTEAMVDDWVAYALATSGEVEARVLADVAAQTETLADYLFAITINAKSEAAARGDIADMVTSKITEMAEEKAEKDLNDYNEAVEKGDVSEQERILNQVGGKEAIEKSAGASIEETVKNYMLRWIVVPDQLHMMTMERLTETADLVKYGEVYEEMYEKYHEAVELDLYADLYDELYEKLHDQLYEEYKPIVRQEIYNEIATKYATEVNTAVKEKYAAELAAYRTQITAQYNKTSFKNALRKTLNGEELYAEKYAAVDQQLVDEGMTEFIEYNSPQWIEMVTQEVAEQATGSATSTKEEVIEKLLDLKVDELVAAKIETLVAAKVSSYTSTYIDQVIDDANAGTQPSWGTVPVLDEVIESKIEENIKERIQDKVAGLVISSGKIDEYTQAAIDTMIEESRREMVRTDPEYVAKAADILGRANAVLESNLQYLRGEGNGIYFTSYDADFTIIDDGAAYANGIVNAQRDGNNTKYYIGIPKDKVTSGSITLTMSWEGTAGEAEKSVDVTFALALKDEGVVDLKNTIINIINAFSTEQWSDNLFENVAVVDVTSLQETVEGTSWDWSQFIDLVSYFSEEKYQNISITDKIAYSDYWKDNYYMLEVTFQGGTHDSDIALELNYDSSTLVYYVDNAYYSVLTTLDANEDITFKTVVAGEEVETTYPLTAYIHDFIFCKAISGSNKSYENYLSALRTLYPALDADSDIGKLVNELMSDSINPTLTKTLFTLQQRVINNIDYTQYDFYEDVNSLLTDKVVRETNSPVLYEILDYVTKDGSTGTIFKNFYNVFRHFYMARETTQEPIEHGTVITTDAEGNITVNWDSDQGGSWLDKIDTAYKHLQDYFEADDMNTEYILAKVLDGSRGTPQINASVGMNDSGNAVVIWQQQTKGASNAYSYLISKDSSLYNEMTYSSETSIVPLSHLSKSTKSEQIYLRSFVESTDYAGARVTSVSLPNGQEIQDGDTITTATKNLVVTFTENLQTTAAGYDKLHAVDNPNNWSILKEGVLVQDVIESITFSMSASRFAAEDSDDERINGKDNNPESLIYGSNQWEAIITFKDGFELTEGSYTLIASNMIHDIAGNAINSNGYEEQRDGSKYEISFTVIPIDFPLAFGEASEEEFGTYSEQKMVDDTVSDSTAQWTTEDLLEDTNNYDANSPTAVASDASGNFVVVWTQSTKNDEGQVVSGGVYYKVYHEEYVINEDGERIKKEVSTLEGETVHFRYDEGTNQYYYYYYDASGKERLFVEYTQGIAAEDFAVPQQASVAMDDSGNFVVVWDMLAEDDQLGAISRDIFARRYSLSGKELGVNGYILPYRVNIETEKAQQNADVAMDSDGDFVIVWESYDQDGSGWGIYGRRFDDTGYSFGRKNNVQVITFTGDFVSQGNFIEITFTDLDGTVYTINNIKLSESISKTCENIEEAFLNFTNAYGQYVFKNAETGEKYISVTQNGPNSINIEFKGEKYALQEVKTLDVTVYDNAKHSGSCDCAVCSCPNCSGNGSGGGSGSGSGGSGGEDDDKPTESVTLYASVSQYTDGSDGEEFEVNETKLGDQRFASIGMNSEGTFVVTWTSWGQDNDDAEESNIYARQFVSNHSLVNTTTKTATVKTSSNEDSTICSVDPIEQHSTSGYSAYTGVGKISIGASGDEETESADEYGSGSLLATGYHVLTAAHVVYDTATGTAYDPDELSVTFVNALGDEFTYAVKEVYIYSDYTGDYLKQTDLAIVVLSSAVDSSIARYDIYTGRDELNQNFTVVGYGAKSQVGVAATEETEETGSTADDEEEETEVKIQSYFGKNTFELLGTDINPGYNYNMLLWDFDDGTRKNDYFGNNYGVVNRGLGDEEAMIAGGDSGGACFINGMIAGVNSWGTFASSKSTPEYGDYGAAVRVSSYADWINMILSGASGNEFLVNTMNAVGSLTTTVTTDDEEDTSGTSATAAGDDEEDDDTGTTGDTGTTDDTDTDDDEGTVVLNDTYQEGVQIWSDVAIDNDGSFVITWTSFNQDGYGDTASGGSSNGLGGVYMRRYVTETIYPGASQDDEEEEEENSGGSSSTGSDYSANYEASGAGAIKTQSVSDVTLVSEYTGFDQAHSKIAMDAQGNYTITWVSYENRVFGTDVPIADGIYARNYLNCGDYYTALGDHFGLATTTTDDTEEETTTSTDETADDTDDDTTSTATNSGTNYFSSIQSYTTGNLEVTETQRRGNVSIASGSIGGAYKVNYLSTADLNSDKLDNQRGASVAMDANGDTVFVWTDMNDVTTPNAWDARVVYRVVGQYDDEIPPYVTDVTAAYGDPGTTVTNFDNVSLMGETVTFSAEHGPSALVYNFSELMYAKEFILQLYEDVTLDDSEYPFSDHILTIYDSSDDSTKRSVLNIANWTMLKDGTTVTRSEISSLYYGYNAGYRLGYSNAESNQYELVMVFKDQLDEGVYTVTLKDEVTDLSENKLDGNYDGDEGGSFTVTFNVGVSGVSAPDDEDEDEAAATDEAVGHTAPEIVSFADGSYIIVTETVSTSITDSESETETDTGTGTDTETEEDNTCDVVFRRYNAAGEALGAETITNVYTAGEQSDPDVAGIDLDNFVVVWTGEGEDGDGAYARFYFNGTRQTKEVRVSEIYQDWSNSKITGTRVVYDSAADAYLVTYLQQKGAFYTLVGRYYSVTGNALSDPFDVQSATYQSIDTYHISCENGYYVVGWSEYTRSTNSTEVFASTFKKCNACWCINKAAGSNGAYRVNQTTSGSQFEVRTAIDAKGNSYFVWTSTQNISTSDWDIYTRSFTFNGNARVGETNVTNALNKYSSTQTRQYAADIDVSADGAGYVITWTSKNSEGINFDTDLRERLYDYGVLGCAFNAEGKAINVSTGEVSTLYDATFLVNNITNGDQTNPVLSIYDWKDAPQFAMAWQGPVKIYGEETDTETDTAETNSSSADPTATDDEEGDDEEELDYTEYDAVYHRAYPKRDSAKVVDKEKALSSSNVSDSTITVSERLDSDASGSNGFYRPSGTDMVILNPEAALETNETLTITGTSGDDVLTIAATADGTVWNLYLNSVYVANANSAKTITFFGLGGTDKVVFTGSAAASAVTINGAKSSMTIASGGFAFSAESVETYEVIGGSTADTLTVVTSGASDRVTIGLGELTLTSSGRFAVTASGFEEIAARASGTSETVVLRDTESNDAVSVSGKTVRLAGGGLIQEVEGFSSVRVLSENGGSDSVTMDGLTNLIATYGQVVGKTSNLLATVVGFRYVTASGANGSSATLVGSKKDDVLVSDAASANLTYYDGASVSASGFKSVAAVGNGGSDTADLTGGSGVNTFTGRIGTAAFTGEGFARTLNGFSTVNVRRKAGSVNSTYKASLYDSVLDDLIEEKDGVVTMDLGGQESYNLIAFDQVTAKKEKNGGNDVVQTDTPFDSIIQTEDWDILD